jgi:hypothetical protein
LVGAYIFVGADILLPRIFLSAPMFCRREYFVGADVLQALMDANVFKSAYILVFFLPAPIFWVYLG